MGILRVMRLEGVGYSLLGSDTAIYGISVGEKAESQRSYIGGTARLCLLY